MEPVDLPARHNRRRMASGSPVGLRGGSEGASRRLRFLRIASTHYAHQSREPQRGQARAINSKSRFHAAMCEVVHTSVETRAVLLTLLGNVLRSRSVVARTNLWDQSVPRVELDQRSREARLRFERVDQSFILRATVTHRRLRRLIYWFTVGRYGGLPQQGGIKELLGDRWPSRLPMLFGLWLIG